MSLLEVPYNDLERVTQLDDVSAGQVTEHKVGHVPQIPKGAHVREDSEESEAGEALGSSRGPIHAMMAITETGIVEAATPVMEAFGNRTALHSMVKNAWKEKGVTATMFKITRMLRKAGLRIWFNYTKDCEEQQCREVVSFMDEFLMKISSEFVKINLSTVVNVSSKFVKIRQN